jgi:hypothetical protein
MYYYDDEGESHETHCLIFQQVQSFIKETWGASLTNFEINMP